MFRRSYALKLDTNLLQYFINIIFFSSIFGYPSQLLSTIATAQKAIFSFSRRPEKMVFPKNLAGKWDFLYFRGKWYFFFLKIYSYSLDRKWKRIFLKKKNKKKRKYNIFFKYSEKKVFSKRTVPGHDLFCIIWKDGILFRKTWYFFLGRKMRDDLSQEIHGNTIFSVYRYRCCKRDAKSLCQKKSKTILSRKNTPTGDWRSRLTF